MLSIAEQLDVLKGYDRWREDKLLTPVDTSVEEYAAELQALADTRLVTQIHAVAVEWLDEAATAVTDLPLAREVIRQIASLTDVVELDRDPRGF